MAVFKTHFNSNPNVGLYGYSTNEYCLLAKEVDNTNVKEIEKVLGVKVHKTNICGTSLIGVFLTGNNKCLLVPSIAFDRELKVLDKLGINYAVIDTDYTALGNNILCNDEIALVNPEIEETAKKQIGKALSVKVKDANIAEISTFGSFIAINDKGALVSSECKDFEKKFLEKSLNIECTLSTINNNSPYIRSGIIVNDKGFIVGSLSNPIEINDADITFGFLEK